MTREEKAIMYFKDMRKKFCEDYLLGIPKDSVAYKATMAEKEFYDTAIKALEQEPCDHPDRCHECEKILTCTYYKQEPKEGHWIKVSDGYGDNAYICECSECKDTVWVYKDANRKWNFCPNCGARMVEEQESEEV